MVLAFSDEIKRLVKLEELSRKQLHDLLDNTLNTLNHSGTTFEYHNKIILLNN